MTGLNVRIDEITRHDYEGLYVNAFLYFDSIFALHAALPGIAFVIAFSERRSKGDLGRQLAGLNVL
jgi:hypothetical protein